MPVIDLGRVVGRDGVPGGGSVTVNGVSPDENGNITLTHENVGALSASGTAADSTKLGGKDASEYATKKDLEDIDIPGGSGSAISLADNLFDNSNFLKPVNQRGETSFAVGSTKAYKLDRWYFARCSASIVTNGLSLAWDGATATNGCFQQIVNKASKAGDVYTIARKMDGVVSAYTFVVPDDTNQGVTFDNGTIAFTHNDGHVIITFYNYSTVPNVYEWVALYEGEYTAETLPPYVPKGYIAELLECQRYFFPLNKNSICFGSTNASKSAFYGDVFTPVPMWRTPSVQAGANKYDLTNNGSQVSISNAMTVNTMTGNKVQLFIRIDNSGMGASIVSKIWAPTNNPYVYLSAEL